MEEKQEFRICKDCGRELPIENFKKTRWGDRVSVCTECAVNKLRENKEKKSREKAMQVREQAIKEAETRDELSAFTGRQLMKELANRGYRGKLTFLQVIDIENL